MVNYSGLQHEVHVSLQQLSELLQTNMPVNGVNAGSDKPMNDAPILSQVSDIFEEDIDQCLPMLQLSSEKLTVLLNSLVSGDGNEILSGNSTH